MASIDLPSITQSLIAVTLFYTLYYVYWQLTVGTSRRLMIDKHGCKPIKDSAELNSFPHNIFSTRIIIENSKALKGGYFLDNVRGRFLRNGTTLHYNTFFTELFTTIEPENIKTLLALNFKDWSLGPRRKSAFVPLLGHGIFTTDGAAWQHSRELLRPNFARNQVGDLATFEIHVRQMIEAIPRDGSTVDLQDLFFQLTMDSASEFLFGESTNCLAPGQAPEHSRAFADAFNRGQEEIAEAFRSGKLGDLLHSKKQFKKDAKTCHEFVDHFVYKGLEYRKTLDLSKGPPEIKEGERYVFLNELVKRTADPIQIRSELLNVLLAGRDTTASLLSDVWFVLARRPDIWNKLKAEVDEFEGQPPTYQQIKDMKYLRMVLNEGKAFFLIYLRVINVRSVALRLYPVVAGNSRAAVVDTVLPLGGGEDGKSPLFMPKGSVMQYSVYAMHRRKDFYGEDADEFKPERWATLRPGWVSLSEQTQDEPAKHDYRNTYPSTAGQGSALGNSSLSPKLVTLLSA